MPKYWVAGKMFGRIHYFNGSTWSIQVLPGVHTASSVIREIAGLSDTRLWALTDGKLYETSDAGVTWTDTGAIFQTISFWGVAFCRGLSVVSETEIYVVQANFAQRWNGSSVSILPSSNLVKDSIHAESGSSIYIETELFGVGKYSYSIGGNFSNHLIPPFPPGTLVWDQLTPNDWFGDPDFINGQVFGNRNGNILLTATHDVPPGDTVQVSEGTGDPGNDQSLWLSTVLKVGFHWRDAGPDWPVYCKLGCVDPSGNSYVSSNDTTTGNNQVAKITGGVVTYSDLGPSKVDEPGAIWMGNNSGCCGFIDGSSIPKIYIFDGVVWSLSTTLVGENPLLAPNPYTVWGVDDIIIPPASPTSTVSISNIFLIAKDVIRVIFSSPISATYNFWSTFSYSLYNNTLSKYLEIKKVLPVDAKATTILDLNVENVTAGENYTLTIANDSVYDIDGVVLDDVNSTFIPQRTKTDSVISSLPNMYDKRPGSSVRSILEAITIEDEKIGGDF